MGIMNLCKVLEHLWVNMDRFELVLALPQNVSEDEPKSLAMNAFRCQASEEVLVTVTHSTWHT